MAFNLRWRAARKKARGPSSLLRVFFVVVHFLIEGLQEERKADVDEGCFRKAIAFHDVFHMPKDLFIEIEGRFFRLGGLFLGGQGERRHFFGM